MNLTCCVPLPAPVAMRPWLPGFTFRRHETRDAVDESELLRRSAGGDTNAFAAVYDKHAPLVYGLCRRMLANDAQAEDVTQNVFTQLWAKPTSFAGGNFAAWIARVARNACLDVLRSAAVRRREPEIPLDLPASGSLEDEVFGRLNAGAVGAALRQLPPEQREAIEQAYFGGLSYREAAERLGIPLGTIKSRIRSGLQSLWQTLSRTVAT